MVALWFSTYSNKVLNPDRHNCGRDERDEKVVPLLTVGAADLMSTHSISSTSQECGRRAPSVWSDMQKRQCFVKAENICGELETTQALGLELWDVDASNGVLKGRKS